MTEKELEVVAAVRERARTLLSTRGDLSEFQNSALMALLTTGPSKGALSGLVALGVDGAVKRVDALVGLLEALKEEVD